MAVKSKGRGEPTAKPRNDAYTGLLAISFLAMVGGSVLLYLDYSDYETTKGPSNKFDLANVPKPQPLSPVSQPTNNNANPVGGAPMGDPMGGVPMGDPMMPPMGNPVVPPMGNPVVPPMGGLPKNPSQTTVQSDIKLPDDLLTLPISLETPKPNPESIAPKPNFPMQPMIVLPTLEPTPVPRTLPMLPDSIPMSKQELRVPMKIVPVSVVEPVLPMVVPAVQKKVTPTNGNEPPPLSGNRFQLPM